MRLVAIALAALALSGCAHKIRYVAVPCVSPAQYDELRASVPPKVRDRLTGNAAEDIKIIAASNVRLRAHAESLLKILEGCARSLD